METWEPDQIFGKADFPSHKKEDGEKPDKEAPKGTPSGKTDPSKKPDASPGNPVRRSGNQNAQGPIKTLKSGGTFSGQGWQPEQINTDNANVIRHRTEEERAADAKGERTRASAVPGAGANANAPAFPTQIFRQAALESPETSIRFLRKWLWEKWPPPGGPKGGAESIEPHDRIFIVLSTLGAKVVQYLFQIMSPRERAEFQKILKRPARHNPVSTAMVCRAFMDGVRDSYQ